MPVAPIHTPKVKPSDVPLEKILSSKALDEQQKTSEMTRQFEAVLLRQILTEAQKPVFKSNLSSQEGVSGAIYKDLMVSQLADQISSSRTLGLAQELEKQLSFEIGQKSDPKKAAPAAKQETKPAAKPFLTKAMGS